MTTLTLNDIQAPEAMRSYATVVSESVVEEVIRLLETAMLSKSAARKEPSPRSIMELQGLGREVWQGIDAAKYISELRDEWNDH